MNARNKIIPYILVFKTINKYNYNSKIVYNDTVELQIDRQYAYVHYNFNNIHDIK